MKKLRLAAVVLTVLFALFVLTHFEPRRERPQGWQAAWAQVPSQPESQWAIDPVEREAMQRLFLQVTERLAHCSAEYVGQAELAPLDLELFLESDAVGPRILYAVGVERAELPRGLVPCLERALERTRPVEGLGVAAGVRWRLRHSFLLHPVGELPAEPWYERLVPPSLKSGGNLPVYVG